MDATQATELSWSAQCRSALQTELEAAQQVTKGTSYIPGTRVSLIADSGEIELEALQNRYEELRAKIFNFTWGCCNIRRYNIVIICTYTVTVIAALALLSTLVPKWWPDEEMVGSMQLGTYAVMAAGTELSDFLNDKAMKLEKDEFEFDRNVVDAIEETQVLHKAAVSMLDHQQHLHEKDVTKTVERLKNCTKWLAQVPADKAEDVPNIDKANSSLILMLSSKSKLRMAFEKEAEQLEQEAERRKLSAASNPQETFKGRMEPLEIESTLSAEQASLLSPVSPYHEEQGIGFLSRLPCEASTSIAGHAENVSEAVPALLRQRSIYSPTEERTPVVNRISSVLLAEQGEGEGVALMQEVGIKEDVLKKKFGIHLRTVYYKNHRFDRNLGIRC